MKSKLDTVILKRYVTHLKSGKIVGKYVLIHKTDGKSIRNGKTSLEAVKCNTNKVKEVKNDVTCV